MMPTLDELFVEAQGDGVPWGGKTLYRCDRIPVSPGDRFRVVCEHASDKRPQGIRFSVNRPGKLVLDGELIPKPLALWCRSNTTADIVISGRRTHELSLYSVWRGHLGSTDAFLRNHAMIITEIPNGRRYECSDGPDELDFEDLIFRIERIPPEEALGIGAEY